MNHLAQDPYEARELEAINFESRCRTIAEHLLNFEFDDVYELTGEDFLTWMYDEIQGSDELEYKYPDAFYALTTRSSDWHTHALELATDFLEFVEG